MSGRDTKVYEMCDPCSVESVAAWRTTVDATDCGGVARFVNHSCAPNCEVVPTRSRRGQFLPTLALVTLKDVAVGVELAFDYAGGAPDDATPPADRADPTGAVASAAEERAPKRPRWAASASASGAAARPRAALRSAGKGRR